MAGEPGRIGPERRGFTLLEAVVALGLATVVLTALYGAVIRAAAAHEHAVRDADRRIAARVLLLAMVREIEAAVPTADANGRLRFAVASAPPDGPPWSALRLATLEGDDDVHLVAYRVDQVGTARETGVLVRRAAPRLAPPISPEPPGEPALPGVRTFRVRCFDGVEWTTSWTRPRLPRAVEVGLAVGDGEELVMTVMPAAGGRS